MANLNPKETLLFVRKQKVYKDGHQFGLKGTLWEAIQEAAEAILTKLTASMDSRLIDVVEKKGWHIKKWLTPPVSFFNTFFYFEKFLKLIFHLIKKVFEKRNLYLQAIGT